MFIPRKLESVKYAGITLLAYPEVDHTNKPSERIFSILTNKNAAEGAYLDAASVVTFYASRAGLDTHARMVMSQWTSRLMTKWADPAALTVISYHNLRGSVINSAVDTATGVLKDITDGTRNTRRPEGVKFALVRLPLDFTDLNPSGAATSTNLEYFLPLPYGPVTFTEPTGTDVTRNTCTIVGDPFALTKEEFKAQVLIPCGCSGPGKIKDLQLGESECTLDEVEKARELNNAIITLGSDAIFSRLKELAAPQHDSSLHSTVEKIKQSYIDDDGNTVTLTVHEYYNATLRAAAPILGLLQFPINVATNFVHNLVPEIKERFEAKSKSHLTFSNLDRDEQLRMLEMYLGIAIMVEKEWNSVKSVVKTAMSDTHAFCAKLVSALGVQVPDDPTNASFISAAEETLRRYGKKRQPTNAIIDNIIKEIICWGCLGKHRYRDPHTKEIICPNKDQPGVPERAAKAHADYRKKVTERKKGFIERK